MLNDEKHYEAAQKRTKDLRGFLSHLVVYIFVLAMLYILGVGSAAGYSILWILGVMWGLGVALHGVYTLVRDPIP